MRNGRNADGKPLGETKTMDHSVMGHELSAWRAGEQREEGSLPSGWDTKEVVMVRNTKRTGQIGKRQSKVKKFPWIMGISYGSDYLALKPGYFSQIK